jgi:copper chaperone NosL
MDDKMKFYFKSLVGILILLYLFACSPEPKPIDFGNDNCHFCDMTIMDNKHAAELVTAKGKVFKFDAIECMLQDIARTDQQEYAYKLISDYSNPGEFINAQQSVYLISKNLPSPMGAFLSGFSSDGVAKSAMEENGGILYNWEQIKAKIN